MTARGAMSGVVVGIVREVDAAQGRIKVDYPWLSPPQRSAWAPVATLMSGNGRGAYFMPEPEDEVLLAFDHGNFEHPYVVGYLWNGADAPPEADAALRVLVTPGNHSLRFEDSGSGKRVVLRSSSGHEVTLDDSAGGRSVTIRSAAGDQSVVLDDKTQSVEVRGGSRIIRMIGGAVHIT